MADALLREDGSFVLREDSSHVLLETTGPATAITLSGPLSGVVNTASTNFTVGADGTITGTITVTFTDSSGAGSFSPSSVNISAGSPTATATYTPTTTGARNINCSNNGSLAAPSNVAYTSNPGGGGGGGVTGGSRRRERQTRGVMRGVFGA